MIKKFIYEDIYEYYKKEILSGNLIYGSKLPDEFCIASIFFCARETVRKALNLLQRENLISSKKKVGSIVIYSTEKKLRLCMIFPVESFEFNKFISSVKKYFFNYNYDIKILFSKTSPKKELALLETLLEENIDGLIINASFPTAISSIWRRFEQKNIPFVFYDTLPFMNQYNCVLSDGFRGTYKSVEYLIKKGHKKIAYFSAYTKQSSGMKERLDGFLTALADNNIQCPSENIYIINNEKASNFSISGAKYLCQHILSNYKNFTAIACGTDSLATALIAHARENLLEIPKNLSIIGHDNNIVSELSTPLLTTFSQNFEKMGEESAKLLEKLILGEKKLIYQIRVLGELVVRDSVKKIKSANTLLQITK